MNRYIRPCPYLLSILPGLATACLLATMLHAQSGAAQSPQSIFPPLQGLILLHSEGAAAYESTSSNANWVVGQWGIPTDLPAFTKNATNNPSASNTDATVTLNQHSYVLEQNGQNLTCDTNYPGGSAPHEFDLFVSPRADPNTTTPVIALNQMSHLQLKLTVDPQEVKSLASSGASPCAVTQGSFLMALSLKNTKSKQTLFYQLRLGVVSSKSASFPNLETTLPGPDWFAKGINGQTNQTGIFGFADDITGPDYNQPALVLNVRQTYAIDVLPRLLEVIKMGAALNPSSSPNVDQDPANWSVGGSYHGENIWGPIAMRSVWNGFSLEAQFPPTSTTP